jgi:hypothetical protein
MANLYYRTPEKSHKTHSLEADHYGWRRKILSIIRAGMNADEKEVGEVTAI